MGGGGGWSGQRGGGGGGGEKEGEGGGGEEGGECAGSAWEGMRVESGREENVSIDRTRGVRSEEPGTIVQRCRRTELKL